MNLQRPVVTGALPLLVMGLGLVLVGVLLGLVIGRVPGTPAGTELAAAPSSAIVISPPTTVPSPTVRLATAIATATRAPSTRPTDPLATPPSTTVPSLAPGDPDAAAVVAIWNAHDRLGALRAYRFTVGVAGRSPIGRVRTGLPGAARRTDANDPSIVVEPLR
jgi:hypothetical protein